MSRRLIALLVAASLAAVALLVVAIRGAQESETVTAQSTPPSRFDGALLPPGVKAADFSLRDQDGRPVTMREYRGRPVIVTFMYSHCKDTCPVEAQQIKGALDDIGRPVPVLSISVDPAGDTPASVKRFNAEQGVTGRIRWVLGTHRELARIWKRYGIAGQTEHAEHTSHIFMVDGRGLVRVGFPPDQTTPERLAHDMRLLLQGA